MSHSAEIAIKAAKNVKAWGYRNARAYANNRGVSMRLFFIAYSLETGVIQ